MRFGLAVSAFVLAGLALPAVADDSVKEGRSVGVAGHCATDQLVCAFMKDGTSVPTSECQAKKAGAVRIVPGDCYDAD